MTLEEFKILAKGLRTVYTSERFLPDNEAIKIWFNMLKDIDYQVANVAIQKYILTNKFPPTIADIRELCVNVVSGDLQSWSESWELVINAIKKFGSYGYNEAMESFDDTTKQCVKRIGFLNLCNSQNLNVDRANYRMIYEQLAERRKADSQIPLKVRELIANIQEQQQTLISTQEGKE